MVSAIGLPPILLLFLIVVSNSIASSLSIAANLSQVCSLPAEKGSCEAQLPMWYHDASSGHCKRFNYTGCGGNQNRFSSEAECQTSCSVQLDTVNTEICELEPKTGPCSEYSFKWFYKPSESRCLPFLYGGCEGNENNFDSRLHCRARCVPTTEDPQVCGHEPDSGPCENYSLRWYYDHSRLRCLSFIYGGCNGNSNSFATKASCEKRCSSQSEVSRICNLHKIMGPCMGVDERWYYNKDFKTCIRFAYGGCGGNENNFESKSDCELMCDNKEMDVCLLPREPGPCEGNFTRWYFNSESGSCELFNFCGYGGNSNNFGTKESCENSCRQSEPIRRCELPPDVGPCKGSIEKWYFDTSTHTCETFLWGGCKGNDNRFDTRNACINSCK